MFADEGVDDVLQRSMSTCNNGLTVQYKADLTSSRYPSTPTRYPPATSYVIHPIIIIKTHSTSLGILSAVIYKKYQKIDIDYIVMTDDAMLQRLCSNSWRPSRLETECIRGDGLTFFFPQPECSLFSGKTASVG